MSGWKSLLGQLGAQRAAFWLRGPHALRPIGLLLVALLALGGCASTGENADPNDPIEPTNREVYDFNDSLDRSVFKPVAQTYADVTAPEFRQAMTNFFNNVSYLNVILNDLLQFKLLQFLSDSGRLVVNTTLGLGGLLDPATDLGLERNDEDLGQTFGRWGADEGAYLVLPLVGPNSVRDAPNLVVSILLNPLTYLAAPITVPLAALNAVNTRADLLDATEFRDQAALDPYTFVREAYRQRRYYLIHDGNPPPSEFDSFMDLDELEAEMDKADEGSDGVEGSGDDGPTLKVF